ncbi:MAG: TIGR02301 family protein [Pseudomonadota bacterium]
MKWYMPIVALGLIVAASLSPSPGYAQTAPYDSRLNALAEVLGSVHYLRNLCIEPSNQWRDEMSQMLAVERPDPIRRSRLVASFNRGYRSFASVYVTCTDQARDAADRYAKRGADLAAEIDSRYAQ